MSRLDRRLVQALSGDIVRRRAAPGATPRHETDLASRLRRDGVHGEQHASRRLSV
jgi:hypothetical protein